MTFKRFLALATLRFNLRGWGQYVPYCWRIGGPEMVAEVR
jgi:hypothetical protein